ncbi:MAG TPA: stage III sporulation protein AF [Oscillospiraceae bacterium]|nr:stage III sporulation protein AF [Oscillospiraceae bacterium]HXK76933.1 stage III sporulation protein AF [Oscillospiraceae bacterium]
MESLAGWAISLCAAGIAVFLCEILLPEGSIAKVFKIAASVFFLTAILAPLLSGFDADTFSDLAESSSAASDTAEKAAESVVISSFESNLESELASGLREAGIPVSGIEANVSLQEDGVTLMIDAVAVWLPENSSANPVAVSEAVRELSGIEPEIHYEGEEHGSAEENPQ